MVNNDGIEFINNDIQENSGIEYIKPVEETVEMPSVSDEKITIPDWDLTPPFDAIDRGEM